MSSDSVPDASTRQRVALGVTFGVTLAAVLGVLAALALGGPPAVATGATSLGIGICVVAGSVVAFAARGDGD